jgi:RimJ/RimL family protein N-acetyltransferase
MILVEQDIELRAVEPEDFAALEAILRRSGVRETLYGEYLNAAGMDFRDWYATASKNGYYRFFTVKRMPGEETLGLAGYQDINYIDGNAEIKAVTDPLFDGANAGVKALRALMRFAFFSLRLEQLALVCMENDGRMRRLAAEAGFRQEALLLSRIQRADRRENQILFGCLKEEFE